MIGISLGVLTPAVLTLVLGLYFTRENHIDWGILYRKKLLSPLIALSAIFNMITFYYGIKTNKLSWARGVLAGTLIAAMVVLGLKTLS